MLWIRIGSMRIRNLGFCVKKKNYRLTKKFLSKIAIYLSQGFRKGRPSYRRSLHPSKEKTSNPKFEISSLLWVIIALLDPDPDPADQMVSDPDPQQRFYE
jgi:hypothetical protein